MHMSLINALRFFNHCLNCFFFYSHSCTLAPDIYRSPFCSLHKLMFSWRRRQVCAFQYPNRANALSFSSVMLLFLHLPSLTWFSQHLTAESEMEKGTVEGERERERCKEVPPLKANTVSVFFSSSERCHDVGSGVFLSPLVHQAKLCI